MYSRYVDLWRRARLNGRAPDPDVITMTGQTTSLLSVMRAGRPLVSLCRRHHQHRRIHHHNRRRRRRFHNHLLGTIALLSVLCPVKSCFLCYSEFMRLLTLIHRTLPVIAESITEYLPINTSTPTLKQKLKLLKKAAVEIRDNLPQTKPNVVIFTDALSLSLSSTNSKSPPEGSQRGGNCPGRLRSPDKPNPAVDSSTLWDQRK